MIYDVRGVFASHVYAIASSDNAGGMHLNCQGILREIEVNHCSSSPRESLKAIK